MNLHAKPQALCSEKSSSVFCNWNCLWQLWKFSINWKSGELGFRDCVPNPCQLELTSFLYCVSPCVSCERLCGVCSFFWIFVYFFVCLDVCCYLESFLKEFVWKSHSFRYKRWKYNIHSVNSHETVTIVVRINWQQQISAVCYKHTLSYSACHSPHMQEIDCPLLGKNKIWGRILCKVIIFTATDWHSFSIFKNWILFYNSGALNHKDIDLRPVYSGCKWKLWPNLMLKQAVGKYRPSSSVQKVGCISHSAFYMAGYWHYCISVLDSKQQLTKKHNEFSGFLENIRYHLCWLLHIWFL